MSLCKAATWLSSITLFGLALSVSSVAVGSSVEFFANAAGDYDYARQLDLPPAFGTGEFTLELWIRPNDGFPVGPVDFDADERNNWAEEDIQPYSSPGWWFEGNFLLDGHNNGGFSNGTFSLQFYGGGRVRWLFGDGANPGPGGVWSVGAYPADANGTPSLLDGAWHQLTLVRRWSGASGATLELWIDGGLVASEQTTSREDMWRWWGNGWGSFPNQEEGWFWGTEKQAAIGALTQYEDYKGLVDELRFWSIAKSPAEISANYDQPVDGSETGLVGHYDFGEAGGSSVCDRLRPAADCMQLVNAFPNVWSGLDAPLSGGGADTLPPSVPAGLQGMAASSSEIELSWNPSSDNVAVSNYDVRRDGTVIATVSTTAFSDAGLSPDTAYVYEVRARDTSGNLSAFSTSVQVTTPAAADTVPPSVPAGLQGAAVSPTRIDLSWNAATDNVAVTSYDLRRDGSIIATVSGTSYSDPGLAPDSAYVYSVRARDAAGNTSAFSSSVTVSTPASSDTTPPSTPANLQGSAVTPSRIDLTWSTASDNVGISDYDVFRDGTFLISVSTTAYSDTGLAANTTYTYTVRANDAAGNSSAESQPASVTTLANPDTTPPGVPTNVQGSAVSSSSVELMWSASTDDVGVVDYIVRRDTNVIATTNQTGYSDSGLSPGTTYAYTISARDAAGNESAPSPAITVTTLTSAPPPSPAPSGGGGGGALSAAALLALLATLLARLGNGSTPRRLTASSN